MGDISIYLFWNETRKEYYIGQSVRPHERRRNHYNKGKFIDHFFTILHENLTELDANRIEDGYICDAPQMVAGYKRLNIKRVKPDRAYRHIRQ